jgi:hypothetical protein
MVSYGFVMFLVDSNRLPSPDLRFSYGFVLFCNIFGRLPSPDFRFSYGFRKTFEAISRPLPQYQSSRH